MTGPGRTGHYLDKLWMKRIINYKFKACFAYGLEGKYNFVFLGIKLI
jgi:hypothetical protein